MRLIFNDWFIKKYIYIKKKKRNGKGWVSSPPAACTQARSVTHITAAEVWDFHREVFNLHWGLASHTAQTKPPTYSHAPLRRLTPTHLSPQEQRKQREPHNLSCRAEFKNTASCAEQNRVFLHQRELRLLWRRFNSVSHSLLSFFFFSPFPGALGFAGPALPSFSMKEPRGSSTVNTEEILSGLLLFLCFL